MARLRFLQVGAGGHTLAPILADKAAYHLASRLGSLRQGEEVDVLRDDTAIEGRSMVELCLTLTWAQLSKSLSHCGVASVEWSIPGRVEYPRGVAGGLSQAEWSIPSGVAYPKWNGR